MKNNKNDKEKKDDTYIICICTLLGISFGVMFDQLALYMSLGLLVSILLSNRNKK